MPIASIPHSVPIVSSQASHSVPIVSSQASYLVPLVSSQASHSVPLSLSASAIPARPMSIANMNQKQVKVLFDFDAENPNELTSM